MDIKNLLQKLDILNESASGGSSSAGGIAPVESSAGNNGNMQRRMPKSKTPKSKVQVDEEEINEEDVLLHPSLKGGQPGFTPRDRVRTDHEVQMATSDLLASGKNAETIYNILNGVSEEQGLPGWVQEKITKASDYLNTVAEYMEGEYQEYIQQNHLNDSSPRGGYGVIAGGTTMEEGQPIYHGSDKPAQPWAAIDRIAGGKTVEETVEEIIDEAWQDDVDYVPRSAKPGANLRLNRTDPSEPSREGGRRSEPTYRKGMITRTPTGLIHRVNNQEDDEYDKALQDRAKDRAKQREIDEAVSPAQQAAIAINMKKKGVKPKSAKESVSEGFKNTFNVGDRVDGPLGTGTIIAVSKNVDVDGRVRVKLDDPSRAGEDGKHRNSFILDTTQLKHIDDTVEEGLKGRLAGAALAGAAALSSMSPAQSRVITGPDGQQSPSYAQQMSQQPQFQGEKPTTTATLPGADLPQADSVDRQNSKITVGGKEYKMVVLEPDSMRPRGGQRIAIARSYMGERGIGFYIGILAGDTVYVLPRGVNEGISEGTITEKAESRQKDDEQGVTEAQSAKSGIYQTDVFGAKAYHAKCMEPNCNWESKRFDRIKQAQAAAEKHSKVHFKQGVAEDTGNDIKQAFQNFGAGISDASLAKGIEYILKGRHQEGENWLRSKKVPPEIIDQLKTIKVNPNANLEQYINDKIIPYVKNKMASGSQQSQNTQPTPTNYSMGLSDNAAAKKIASKLIGMPVTQQNVSSYVKRYLSMVGRTEKDLPQLSSLVIDELDKQGVAEDTMNEGSIPVYKSPSQFYAGGKSIYKLFRNAFPNLPEHVANDIYNQTSPGTNDTIVNALKQGQDPKSVFLNYYSGITFNFSKDPGTSLTPQQMKTVLLNGRWGQKILTVNPADFAEHSRNRMIKRNFGINPDEDPTRIQRQQSRAKGDGSNEPVIIIQTSNGLILWEGFHRTMSILALGKNGPDPLKWTKVKLRAWVVEISNQQGVAEGVIESLLMPLITYPVNEGISEGTINEKAKSKQQQKFFGMVRAMQKGERVKGASAELKKAAKSISKKDVKDFAKTKHKGLPTKVDEDVDVSTYGYALNEALNESLERLLSPVVTQPQPKKKKVSEDASVTPGGVGGSTKMFLNDDEGDEPRIVRRKTREQDGSTTTHWIVMNYSDEMASGQGRGFEDLAAARAFLKANRKKLSTPPDSSPTLASMKTHKMQGA